MADPSTRTTVKHSTSEFYNERYAGDYMHTDAYSVWGHGDLRTRQVLETLSFAQIRPRRILDYGCGVGGWIGTLFRVFPEAEISGVDISSTAIAKATKQFPACRLESFSGITAPFADDEFDLVFSYHVLEHVDDIQVSVSDIARMLRAGGYAVLIFPCGNEGSFLERSMRLLEGAWLPTPDGRSVLFFETDDGHVRRMTSRDTLAICERCGLQAVAELFSGHLFGTLDWLCRGTGPAYINKVFSGRPPVGHFARFRLQLIRRALLAAHRLIGKKSLDLTKKRNPVKQSAVALVRLFATLADQLLTGLSSLEWRLFKRNSRGTVQYLVLRKAVATADA